MPADVGTSTSQNATIYPHQEKALSGAGRDWVWYYDGPTPSIGFSSRPYGGSFGAFTTYWTGSSHGARFSIFKEGKFPPAVEDAAYYGYTGQYNTPTGTFFTQRPQAIYDDISKKTFIAYMSNNGFSPHITYFDHVTKRFGTAVEVATISTTDGHVGPALLMDVLGYLYVFYGGANLSLRMKKSTNPRDISSWGSEKVISTETYLQYPMPVLIAGTIYLFIRRYQSSPYKAWEAYFTSTDGGNTWTGPTDLIDFGTPNNIYAVVIKAKNGSVHIAWTYYNNTDQYYHNVYYMYTDDMVTWKKRNGTTITLPANSSNSDLVYSDSNVKGFVVDIQTDENNAPYILFRKEGTYYFSKYTTSWVTSSITTSGDAGAWNNGFLDWACLRVKSSTDFDVYLTKGGQATKDGGEIELWESSNGTSWSKSKEITQNSPNQHNMLKTVADGLDELPIIWSYGDASPTKVMIDTLERVCIVRCQGASVNIYYNQGILKSDGTIAWDNASEVQATSDDGYDVNLCKDSDGYPWISYFKNSALTLMVVKATSTKGATWGTPTTLWASDGSATRGLKIIALTAKKLLAIANKTGAISKSRLFNGTSWEAEVNASSSYPQSYVYVDAVNEGDNVHLVFLKQTTYAIIYIKYTYGTGWSSETVVQASTTATSGPTCSLDEDNVTLYVFWAGSPTVNHIFYKKCVNGTWDSAETDWIPETALTSNEKLTSFFKDQFTKRIGLVYMTGSASPYTIRFEFLSIKTKVIRTYTIDFFLQKTFQKPAIFDAAIQKQNITKPFLKDILLSTKFTKPLLIDIEIQKAFTKAIPTDIAILKTLLPTYPIDVILQSSQPTTKSFLSDLLLQKGFSRGFLIDVRLVQFVTYFAAHAIDLDLQQRNITKPAFFDLRIIKLDITKIHNIDIILAQFKTTNFASDFLIQKTSILKTIAIDTAISKAFSAAFLSDIVTVQRLTTEILADILLTKAFKTISFLHDLAIQKTVTKTILIDVNIGTTAYAGLIKMDMEELFPIQMQIEGL